MKTLKVALVAPLPPPYGGIAHWTAMVAEYAKVHKGIDLVILNTAPTWRSIHKVGIFVRSVGGGLQLLRDITRLIRVLVDRPDVLHLATSGHLAVLRDLAFVYVAKLFRVGLVYHIRFGRIPAIAESNFLEWRLIRHVMHRAASVILIDQASLLAVNRFSPNVRATLVPNCIDIGKLPLRISSNFEVKTAMFLGWVVPTKGIGELVESWAALRPKGWRLEIVGPYSDDYQAHLMTKFRPHNLIFNGELSHDQAMLRMANADLFVFPSYTEGFPNVVLEAMALGLPILATRVGAIPEMLSDGAGILVNPKDRDSLEKELSNLLANPTLRYKIGKKAQEKAVKNFSLTTVFLHYIDIWHSAASVSRKY